MKLKSSLIKGLEPDQASELRADFISAHLLRKRLKEVLHEKIESKRTSVSLDYDSANWQYRVAHTFGYEEALKEVISILSGDEN